MFERSSITHDLRSNLWETKRKNIYIYETDSAVQPMRNGPTE